MTEPLPQEFTRLIASLEAPQLSGLPEALDTPAITAVRVNALKGVHVPDGAERVGWCDTGYYPDTRPAFTLDPAMHQGLYYVQEASSMIQKRTVSQIVGLIASETGESVPLIMLDACAAPGGKTTCAIESLPDGSVMVANELSPQRAAVLVENLIKHGSPDCIVTCGDAVSLGAAGPLFDIIAVDAPCSGEGMMRKEAVARSQWSPRLVAECAALQKHITASLWNALKPGGFMIYSTCTFNTSEDEDIVMNLVSDYGAIPVDMDPDPAWNIAPAIGTDLPCMRFIPGLTRGEGLFMAVLRKPGTIVPGLQASANSPGRRNRGVHSGKAPGVPEIPSAWLLDKEPIIQAAGEILYAVSPQVAAAETLIAPLSRIIHRGVAVGRIKGGKLIPDQGLAMSVSLAPGAFDRVDIGRDMAVDYLRRQAVILPGGTPTGHILLTYGGYPLGFVNNIGRRANNLYPQSWRILTTRT